MHLAKDCHHNPKGKGQGKGDLGKGEYKQTNHKQTRKQTTREKYMCEQCTQQQKQVNLCFVFSSQTECLQHMAQDIGKFTCAKITVIWKVVGKILSTTK